MRLGVSGAKTIFVADEGGLTLLSYADEGGLTVGGTRCFGASWAKNARCHGPLRLYQVALLMPSASQGLVLLIELANCDL